MYESIFSPSGGILSDLVDRELEPLRMRKADASIGYRWKTGAGVEARVTWRVCEKFAQNVAQSILAKCDA
jgi:hypothetical protein